jgi:predicted O-linked N-acetylglucosamine transferase (SPINDLY family)
MCGVAKASDPALEAWSRILAGVANSRLLLNCPNDAARRRITAYLAAKGISSGRLEFVPFRPWEQYIETFHRIDVALDPFPFGGGITTCDTLWMGVPVVSLIGSTAVGRGGNSILHNIGLPELAAHSVEEYVRLACDWERWVDLRATLRRRMLDSPLTDAGGFARDVESVLRQMWRAWCEKSSA